MLLYRKPLVATRLGSSRIRVEVNSQVLGSERRENRRLGQGNLARAASIRLV
jgi:hypothetical protein